MPDLGFIHQFVPGAEPNARVLLLLHGTGGDENDLLPLGRQLDPTAALLSPRGQVLEAGLPRFFRRFAEGVFDEADIIRRAGELADFIEGAAAHYRFAPSRITAVGYSNGANIAAALLLLRPKTFPAAILFRAMPVFANPPVAALEGIRILLSAGDDDPIIPLTSGEALVQVLRASGAEVTLEIQAAGHGLVRQDLLTAKAWLERA